MKTSVILLTALCSMNLFAQGTAFTYQGRLNNNGAPANGTYDLLFTIYASATGTNDAFANQTNAATVLSNGLFTTTLNFGPGIFTGEERWLEIAVRPSGSSTYTNLNPRQKITATPYAVTASNITGSIGATQLNGTIPLAQLPAAVVTNNQSGVNLTGSFSGNGAGLNNITAVATNAWRLDGNAGTTAGAQFLGTTDNQALAVKVNNVIALQFVPGTTLPNLVGGLGAFRPSVLTPGVSGAVIAGGNAPSGGVSGFGGGDFHAVYDNDGTVGGGFGNKVGSNNGDLTDGAFATVAGGVFNSAANYAATVAGGDGNYAGGQRSFIGGGYGNQAQANFSVAGGGFRNSISTNSDYSIIGGGDNNSIEFGSASGTISGGSSNTIRYNSFSTIGGGDNNSIYGGSASSSTISGGSRNAIWNDAYYSTIGGGELNTIQSANLSTIGGGDLNTIDAYSSGSTIGGGYANKIDPIASDSTIGGGYGNTIQFHAFASTIGGGNGNVIGSSASVSTIGGGGGNGIGTNAVYATIGGGESNTIQTNATHSTIGGGYYNSIAAGSFSASIPGGDHNSATSRAFAAGTRAKANHTGAFVWADSQDADFASTGTNQFLIRAGGGVGIGTTSPAAALDVRGNVKLGSSGELFGSGGVENLRILRGHIVGTTGSTAEGFGFTAVRNAPGRYTITFGNAFPGRPSITVTPLSSPGGDPLFAFVESFSFSASAATIRILDIFTGTETDNDFFFIAIGPR